jgi:CheY-like chemotaxis protein
MEFELDQDQTPKGVILNGFKRDFSTLHLLMAEDNDVNALVLGKIIKKWGYTYDRVPNGSLAVEAVQSKNYDCILMDIQMPVMDGFEATERIKGIKDIPIIALTAAAKLEIMERIESSGFDGFVAKPIDAAELLKAIKEVVSAKSHQF